MAPLRFRGMSVNGQWHYGLVSISQGQNGQPESGHYISNNVGMPWAYEVRPETIGQFTGLKDKNGAEIFEGDVVRQGRGSDKEIGAVKWDDSWGCFSVGIAHVADCSILDAYREEMKSVKVIGNIYQHPELIK